MIDKQGLQNVIARMHQVSIELDGILLKLTDDFHSVDSIPQFAAEKRIPRVQMLLAKIESEIKKFQENDV